MKTFRIRKAGSSTWLGIAAVVALFAFSASLQAQDDNKRERPRRGERNAQPATGTAPAPAPSQPSVQPTPRRERPAPEPGAATPSGRPDRGTGTRPNPDGGTGAYTGGRNRNPGTVTQTGDTNRNRDTGTGTRPNPDGGTGTYTGGRNRNPGTVTQPGDVNRDPGAGTGTRPNPDGGTGTYTGGRNRNPGSVIQPGDVNRNRDTGTGTYTGDRNRNPGTVTQPGDVNRNPGAGTYTGGRDRNPGIGTGTYTGGGNRNPGTGRGVYSGTTPGTRSGGPVGVTRYPNGNVVRRDSRGDVREVRTRDRVIIRQPTGGRRVVVERPGRTIVVTNRRGYGYVQRPYTVRNQTYVQRAYYSGGRSYTRIYRPYFWGGISLHAYAPVRYYTPAFYGWAYSPWVSPVSYRWSWMGSPWHTYYRGYFTPYPVYASASLWLTDYLISSTLEQAYQDRMDANASMQPSSLYGDQGALTPDVKQAIADEVRRQLAQENGERQAMSSEAPLSGDASPLFGGSGTHVFVVSSSLYVTSGGGQECAISEGDVLQLNGPPSPNASAADVVVLASKAQGCPKGSVVSVSLQDLQDMHNSMRETIDQGLGELQNNKGGLPAPPASAQAPPIQASYFDAAPPVEQGLISELSQQAQEASQAEQEVVSQALAPEPVEGPGISLGANGPITISIGQTTQQVEALLGTPKTVVDLGGKKIYLYKDMKITFVGGTVSDVQ